MARIRTIKPEFWRSPDVLALDYFQRLLYIGLWNLADDEGRGEFNPAAIAADLFLTEYSLNPHGVLTEASNAFGEFQKRDMVHVYEVKNRRYFQVVNWSEHQRVNRPSPSKFPPPELGEPVIHGGLTEDSLNDHGELTEGSLPEQGTGNREQGTGNKDMSETSSDVSTPKPHTYPEAFQTWWRTYPRHKNASKKKALDSWRKACAHIDSDRLLELTAIYADNPGVDEVRLIPHPTTWLNEHRWESIEEQDRQPPRQLPKKSGWDFGDGDEPIIVDAEVTQLPRWEIAQ